MLFPANSSSRSKVRQYFHRYTDDALDLCDNLGSYVPGGKVKLDEVSKILGLTGKPEGIDGRRVEEMVRAGQIEEVARAAASDQESAMSKNRFLSSSVLASRAIRKNSSAMWRCSSAVVIDVLLLPLRSQLLFLHVIGFCAFSRDPCPAPPLLRGNRRGWPRACRRTLALMARLAMWKAGDYLLPPQP